MIDRIKPRERAHSDMMLLSHWLAIGICLYSYALNTEFCFLVIITMITSYYYHWNGERDGMLAVIEKVLANCVNLYAFIQLGYIRNHYIYGFLLMIGCVNFTIHILTSYEKVLYYEHWHLFNHLTPTIACCIIPLYGSRLFLV